MEADEDWWEQGVLTSIGTFVKLISFCENNRTCLFLDNMTAGQGERFHEASRSLINWVNKREVKDSLGKAVIYFFVNFLYFFS